MRTYDIPNTLRSQKLADTVTAVVDDVSANEVVLLQNQRDFTNSVVEVAELAKRALLAKNLRVFQSTDLRQSEVLAPLNETDPLQKPKVHHYAVKLLIKLSRDPIDVGSGSETGQVFEPTAPAPAALR